MSRTELRKITDEDIQRSPNSSAPKNTSTSAKVVSVHDGDTCDLVIRRKSGLKRFKCRLADIDAPELETGRKAEKARDFLAWLSIGEDPEDFPKRTKPWSEDEVQNRLDENEVLVHAEFHGFGHYGRPLVTLKEDSEDEDSFNDLLMEYGYAKPYEK
jgi:endonuclease YncB( thermonuclease family)